MITLLNLGPPPDGDLDLYALVLWFAHNICTDPRQVGARHSSRRRSCSDTLDRPSECEPAQSDAHGRALRRRTNRRRLDKTLLPRCAMASAGGEVPCWRGFENTTDRPGSLGA